MSENQDSDHTVVMSGAAGAPAPGEEDAVHNALPIGTKLGEFEITGLIGEGGFGIVYLAQDHSLQRKVALKEYMPASLAARSAQASVVVRSQRHKETFDIGRRSFVNEARLLAQFDHPALVKVYRFWEANGTAYMVMPYFQGQTLREVLEQNPAPPDEIWVRKTLSPVMDALELIHREHCFHRDIAPDNIILLADGRPVLLDFGAARRVIGDMTQALTVILKPGYAPIEQYAEMPGMKQGAWTDVYALAAVIYFMIARKLPPPSVSRMVQDSYEPLASLAAGRYSEALLKGVDLCLSVRPEHRPQSIAQMREALGFPIPAQTPAPVAANTVQPSPASAPTEKPDASVKPGNKKKLMILGLILGLVLILAGAGFAAYRFFTRLATPQDEAAKILLQSAPSLPPAAEPTITPAQSPAAVPEPMALTPEPVSSAPQAESKVQPLVQPLAPPEPPKPSRNTTSRPLPENTSPPAERPARRPVEKPKPAQDQSEREYMRQLNKDLDKLLGQ